MGSNLGDFKKEMTKLKKAISNEVTASVQNVVEQIFLGLRMAPPIGTPIATGWARAGWRISLDTPTAGSVDIKGNVGPEETKSRNSLKQFLNRKSLAKVSHIFIDNRVPYIETLNNGESSKQSPKMFIEMAVQRGAALAKRKRRVRL